MNTAHTGLSLYKIVSRRKSVEWRYPSAMWGLRGIPGLLIVRENWSESPRPKPPSYWKVHKRGTEIEPYIDPLADRIHASLVAQAFSTRHEALQAVEVALMLIKAEEEAEG